MTPGIRKGDASSEHNDSPLIIVISGPSGVGKDAIINRLKERKHPFFFLTTMTTRKKRKNETDKVDYHFVSLEEFQTLQRNCGFLETANVYGNWYGVPKQPVKEAISRGQDTLIKVDVQGAASIKKVLPEAIFIFVNAPSVEDLVSRLNHRATETNADLSLRLQIAQTELKKICDFDYVVMNPHEDLESAVKDILAIVKAEKCRVKQRVIKL